MSVAICTMVLSYEYPHDTHALYGADGQFLDDSSNSALAVTAHTEHGCDMLTYETVWDGAIMRSTYFAFEGVTEWDYEWPDTLGDWLTTPIPDEPGEGDE